MRSFSLRASAALLVLVSAHACGEVASPSAGRAFVPLAEDEVTTRNSFDRGAAAGGAAEVLWVRSVCRVADYRVGYEDSNVVFPNAIEAHLEVAAGERRGQVLVYRGPLPDGLCGYMEDDPAHSVCADVSFVPNGIAVGQLWAALTAPQGGPELGAMTMMAGRRVPDEADPEAVLADLESFLVRSP